RYNRHLEISESSWSPSYLEKIEYKGYVPTRWNSTYLSRE
ncbi:hypothetical protein TorRG33x02_114320, partial [Trema orientale]